MRTPAVCGAQTRQYVALADDKGVQIAHIVNFNESLETPKSVYVKLKLGTHCTISTAFTDCEKSRCTH